MTDQTQAIKESSRRLGEQFERHGAQVVDEYAQFTMGVFAQMKEAGADVHIIDTMRGSAGIAASNAANSPELIESIENGLLGDEELTRAIIEANNEIQL